MNRLSLIIFLALLVGAPGALAHPWHTSFAELGWNDDGDTLEVSLRVLPEDLETALTWRRGETVVLADNPDVRSQTLAYLAERFLLHSESGEVFRPGRLLGMEIGHDAAWLYFTIAADTGLRLSLYNAVLMDVEGTQTNRARPLWLAPRDTLLFTAARPEQSLWQGR
ncbi:DUF6702 family protein [Parahaliea mediterranea]|uniref:Uncharacterized protein n=1 Tax=Parahaliea mediterranea TaxID=651086 RepID=A0A939ILL1_9GAMM|nr:DUF6702 family protein [Parahaliea mediterranea]MBN7796082.1 hypothetical protein [Parahaliea mediterranea]